MADNSFIPFHRPSIGTEETDAVMRVLQSKWLTTGPVTLEFEREFAAYLGVKHALAVNSGTAALQLALDAIGLKAGDEVIVPTNTFTATGEVVTYFGARPVLCDSLPGGFNMDPADVRRKITSKTRALIPVHIAGQCCAMDELRAIADEHRLHIVEDAAHALPTTYRGKKVGTISDLTAFSFYATKTLTTAEGGMLTSNDEGYIKRVSLMRLHGIGGDAWKRYSATGSWYYEVQDAGYKMNLCDILSALGRAQLKKVDQFWRERCQIRAKYDAAFRSMPELQLPPADAGDVHAWHLYILRIRPELLEVNRNQFIEELKKLGIGTSVHFIPLHLHPYYARTYGYHEKDFPNANDAFSRCLSLPIYPDMSEQEVQRVIASVQGVVQKNRKSKSVAAMQ
ncbi:MAG TPA: DegT/DnrJ/EryC1/StrS family aminotransferase [Terriglobales bacterium]|nr:DegT/DnrJ/EryC1/StrS family aminotransferase [Terriglobales bacterium]